METSNKFTIEFREDVLDEDGVPTIWEGIKRPYDVPKMKQGTETLYRVHASFEKSITDHLEAKKYGLPPRLLENLNSVMNYFVSLPVSFQENKFGNVHANMQAFLRYPEVFDVPFMSCPNDEIDGVIVSAKSLALQTKLQLSNIEGEDRQAALEDQLYQVIDELAAHFIDLKNQGIQYVPYVPLELYQGIDPVSYMPTVVFKTRYGIITPEKS